MTTWFTSDQHFGHRNIIGYCDRPFADVDEMNAELVRRWNDVVQEGDIVYVLGDFALGRMEEILVLTGQLVGRKILLAGNHDRCFVKGTDKRLTQIGVYIEAGFSEIHQGTMHLEVGGIPVQANHFPFVGDSHDGDRFTKHRPVDDGGWLLHGHVHEKWRRRSKMINVGVDVWDFYPVSEAQIAELMALEDPWSPEAAARKRAEDEQAHRSRVMDATLPRL